MFFLSCLPQEGSKRRLMCPLTDKESDGRKGRASWEPSDNPARNGRASTCKVAASEPLLLNEMVFIRHWQLSGGKWINKRFPLGHFPTVLDLYLQMFKEFPFTWGFMTVIIARAERKLPSIWLLLLQRAVQKPCHLNHRTETLWRKTNAAFFSLKKEFVELPGKARQWLAEILSFRLSRFWQKRTDHHNGMSEWLILVSIKDQIIPVSPSIRVKDFLSSGDFLFILDKFFLASEDILLHVISTQVLMSTNTKWLGTLVTAAVALRVLRWYQLVLHPKASI